ncbi:MAG: SH3 domain-containing protein [Flavobacteriales bacterium]|nr:SH3 domain-containing protein [Flavobacteriales bacterium]
MNPRIASLLVGLLIHGSTMCLTRTEADSLVSEAQRHYIAADHQAALENYILVEETFDSPALQLGIGNCWFKLGDVPRAILHYERGLRLAPGDADLRANLDLANTQVKDRIPGDPDNALSRTWAALRGGADPDQWARRSLWLSAILFSLLALARIVNGRMVRRSAYAAAGICAILLLVSTGFAYTRHRELQTHGAAIILAPKVDVRAEPREGSKVLFILHKGTKVEVRDTTQGWSEVRIANGAIGWMPPRTLERI